jgi:hypothetical protein
MSSPRLSNLKLRVDHLLIGLGGLVIVVVAVMVVMAWRARGPDLDHAELDQGLEHMRDNDRSAEVTQPRPPRFVRPLHSSSHGGDRRDQVSLPQPPPEGDPGSLDADEAVASFKQVLGELETVAASGRKLSPREEAEFYNRATGSFTALSAWVDGSDPTERALMNDAYAQMKSLMRELDIQPPPVDPDGRPARR